MLCISAAYAVIRCPSVRSSVCLSRSCILSKRIKTYLQFFSPSNSHTILAFLAKRYGNIPTGTEAKIAIFDQYLALASTTAGPSRVVNISTVEYWLQHLLVVRLPRSTNAAAPCFSESCLCQKASTLNRRQQNILIVRNSKSEAEVTNSRTYCNFEATDRHEASHVFVNGF